MGSLDPLPLGTLAQSPIDSGEAYEYAVQVLVVGAGVHPPIPTDTRRSPSLPLYPESTC